ncbi:hypothetical protein HDU93_007503 [Gonapodya sp. JEL0774]|nr:hypothetical protein HDU93_007503 [Gonapodya sp. JEL0774]
MAQHFDTPINQKQQLFRFLRDFASSYPHEDGPTAQLWAKVGDTLDTLIHLTREDNVISFQSSQSIQQFLASDAQAVSDVGHSGRSPTPPSGSPKLHFNEKERTIPLSTLLAKVDDTVREKPESVDDWDRWWDAITALETFELRREKRTKSQLGLLQRSTKDAKSNELPARFKQRVAAVSRSPTVELKPDDDHGIYVPTGFVPKRSAKASGDGVIVIDSDTESEAEKVRKLNSGFEKIHPGKVGNTAAENAELSQEGDLLPNFNEEYEIRVERIFELSRQVEMRAELTLFEMKRQYVLHVIVSIPDFATRLAEFNALFPVVPMQPGSSVGASTQSMSDEYHYFFPEKNPRDELRNLIMEDPDPHGRTNDDVLVHHLRHPFRRSRALLTAYMRQLDRVNREIGYMRRHMVMRRSRSENKRSTYANILAAAEGSESSPEEWLKGLKYGYDEEGFGAFPKSGLGRYGLFEEGYVERIVKWCEWEREGWEEESGEYY